MDNAVAVSYMENDVLPDSRWIELKKASEITGIRVGKLKKNIKGGRIPGRIINTVKGSTWEVLLAAGKDSQKVDRSHLCLESGRSIGELQEMSSHMLFDSLLKEKDNRIEEQSSRISILESVISTIRVQVKKLESEKKAAEKQLALLPGTVDDVVRDLRNNAEDIKKRDTVLLRAKALILMQREKKNKYKAEIAALQQRVADDARAKAMLRAEWGIAMAEAEKPWWKKLFGL